MQDSITLEQINAARKYSDIFLTEQGGWYSLHTLVFAMLAEIGNKHQNKCLYTNNASDTPYIHDLIWNNQSTKDDPKLEVSYKQTDKLNNTHKGIFTSEYTRSIPKIIKHVNESGLDSMNFFIPIYAGKHFLAACVEYNVTNGAMVSIFDPFGSGGYDSYKDAFKNDIKQCFGGVEVKFKESLIKIKESFRKVQFNGKDCGPWSYVFLRACMDKILNKNESVYDDLEKLVDSIAKTKLDELRKHHNSLILNLKIYTDADNVDLESFQFQIEKKYTPKLYEDTLCLLKINNGKLTINDQIICNYSKQKDGVTDTQTLTQNTQPPDIQRRTNIDLRNSIINPPNKPNIDNNQQEIRHTRENIDNRREHIDSRVNTIESREKDEQTNSDSQTRSTRELIEQSIDNNQNTANNHQQSIDTSQNTPRNTQNNTPPANTPPTDTKRTKWVGAAVGGVAMAAVIGVALGYHTKSYETASQIGEELTSTIVKNHHVLYEKLLDLVNNNQAACISIITISSIVLIAISALIGNQAERSR